MKTGMTDKTGRQELEATLSSLRWTQGPVVSFITRISYTIRDLQELRDVDDPHSYNSAWCINAMDGCLSSHDEMTSHINNLSSSRTALLASIGDSINVPALTFENYVDPLEVHAIVIDENTTDKRKQLRNVNSSQQL